VLVGVGDGGTGVLVLVGVGDGGTGVLVLVGVGDGGTGVLVQAAALKTSPLVVLQTKNAARAAAVTNAPISTVRDHCVDMNRSLLPIRTSTRLANQKAAAFSIEDSG
jgi:hypothetical protein